MTEKLQIVYEGINILKVRKGERMFRYLYGSGRWDELKDGRRVYIEQEELFN